MSVNRRATLSRSAALAAASLLGGVIALGGVALTGDLGGGTTTVVQTTPAPSAATQVAHDTGLSVGEIYARAAPGVVRATRRTIPQDTRLSPLASPSAVAGLAPLFVIARPPHLHELHVLRAPTRSRSLFQPDNLRATLSNRPSQTSPFCDCTISRGLTPPLGNSGVVFAALIRSSDRHPFGLARTTTAASSSPSMIADHAPNVYPITTLSADAHINAELPGAPGTIAPR